MKETVPMGVITQWSWSVLRLVTGWRSPSVQFPTFKAGVNVAWLSGREPNRVHSCIKTREVNAELLPEGRRTHTDGGGVNYTQVRCVEVRRGRSQTQPELRVQRSPQTKHFV